MTAYDGQVFASRVLSSLDRMQRVELSHKEGSPRPQTGADGYAPVTTGHPDFSTLELGASGNCEAVALFIDLEQFTQRTFWDPPREVVHLAHAVLAAVAEVVVQFGGYVLGLRGDGLFACFGCRKSRPDVDAALALAAGTKVMHATQSDLNPMLEGRGIRPVQVRAGADFGRLDFVRIGTTEVSEVNVVGFAANFAAKCEKYANSWEFVVGEGLRNLLDSETAGLFSMHEQSPKRYTRDYETKEYRFYDVAWNNLVPDLVGIAEQLDGNSTGAITIY